MFVHILFFLDWFAITHCPSKHPRAQGWKSGYFFWIMVRISQVESFGNMLRHLTRTYVTALPCFFTNFLSRIHIGSLAITPVSSSIGNWDWVFVVPSCFFSWDTWNTGWILTSGNKSNLYVTSSIFSRILYELKNLTDNVEVKIFLSNDKVPRIPCVDIFEIFLSGSTFICCSCSLCFMYSHQNYQYHIRECTIFLSVLVHISIGVLLCTIFSLSIFLKKVKYLYIYILKWD